MDQIGDASVQWDPIAEDPNAGRRLRRIEPLISTIRHGRLRIRLPNGRILASSDAEAGLQAVLVIERWRALRRLAFGGDVGFAEAYVDGDWTSPDPVALLRLAARNGERLSTRRCAARRSSGSRAGCVTSCAATRGAAADATS